MPTYYTIPYFGNLPDIGFFWKYYSQYPQRSSKHSLFPQHFMGNRFGPVPYSSRSSIDLSKLAHILLKKSEKQIQPWPKQMINHRWCWKMVLSPYGLSSSSIKATDPATSSAAYHRLVLLLQLLDEVVCTCRLSRLLNLRLLRYFSCCAVVSFTTRGKETSYQLPKQTRNWYVLNFVETSILGDGYHMLSFWPLLIVFQNSVFFLTLQIWRTWRTLRSYQPGSRP